MKHREILNELLVKNFKDITKIEELVLKKHEVTKDLTMQEIHTIECVGDRKYNLMSEMASELRVTIATLSVAINKLLNKGYIEKERSLIDKRIVNLNLTKLGAEVYKLHRKFHEEMINTVINKMDTDELTTIILFLEEINEFFVSKYKLRLE